MTRDEFIQEDFMDQFQWFQTVAIIYIATMLFAVIIYRILNKLFPKQQHPMLSKIMSIKGRQLILRFFQNFFTFMSGYVNSNCFTSIMTKQILLNITSKKMSFFSKLLYSIRNCNRFLISPTLVKMLWDNCSKFKFSGFYNFNFLFFILGALGDLFDIFFCIGEHFSVIYKLKIYGDTTYFNSSVNFSNFSWLIASILYIQRDLVGFYMLKSQILKDQDNFLRGFLIINLIQNICEVICAYECIFQGSITNQTYGIYGMILSLCLWKLYRRKRQNIQQSKRQKKQN